MAKQRRTTSQLYASLQPFIIKEIQTQFPQQYDEYATKYGVAETPLHTHNGLDSPKLSQANITPGFRASGNITLATNGRRYTLDTNFNPSLILFYGNAVHVTGFTFTLNATHSATMGAIYKDANGAEYTVAATIVSQSSLTTNYPNALPPATGVLTKFSGTGDTTIQYTSVSQTNDIRAHCIGSANLGPSYFFEPVDSSTVAPSNTVGNVIQSSSNLLINGSGTGPATQTISDEGHLISVQFSGVIVARATIPNPWTGPNLVNNGYGTGYFLLDVELTDGWQINGNFVVN